MVDLSSIEIGEEFTLYYIISLEAIDTAQFDSFMRVYARDPIDPDGGTHFEYGGIEPVPEPAAAAQLGAAALALAGISRWRRRRRARGASRHSTRA